MDNSTPRYENQVLEANGSTSSTLETRVFGFERSLSADAKSISFEGHRSTHPQYQRQWFSTRYGNILLAPGVSVSNLSNGEPRAYPLWPMGFSETPKYDEIETLTWPSHTNSDSTLSLDEEGGLFREQESRPSCLADQRGRNSRLQGPSPRFEQISAEQPAFIDLDDIEDRLELWFEEEQRQSSEDATARGQVQSSRMLANLPRATRFSSSKFRKLNECRYDKFYLAPTSFVELKPDENGLHQFLQIKNIIQNIHTQEIELQGHFFRRCRNMDAMLERKRNEIARICEIYIQDHQEEEKQSLVAVPLNKVLRKRLFHFTNHIWPEDKARDNLDTKDQELEESLGALTVRWNHIIRYTNKSKLKARYAHYSLEHFKQADISRSTTWTDNDLRSQWRDETIPGGAYRPFISREKSERYPKTTSSSELANSGDESSRPRGVKRQCLFTDASTTERPYKRCRVDTTDYESNCNNNRRADIHCSPLDLENSQRSDREGQPASIVTGVPERNLEATARLTSPTTRIDISESELSKPPVWGSITSTAPLEGRIRAPGQALTYGDGFCGAGGMTRGAALAGLHIKWGFDEDKGACSTWRENFPNATCYEAHSSEFELKTRGIRGKNDAKVDILHLSPPCQLFSPAHTVNGWKDEINLASLFAAGDIIKVARPRVVTLEQTFGIMLVKFQLPGEILPTIPPPTHSPTGRDGLLPYTTVNETLDTVSPWDPNNEHCRRFEGDNRRRPWDGSRILPRAITCHGGLNYHPSGTRDFTIAEYAALQGFPPIHTFCRPYIKRQIGNAVPPSVARILFQSIKEQLDRADGITDSREWLIVEDDE